MNGRLRLRPDFEVTVEQAFAEGSIVDLGGNWPRLAGRPIRWCSRALYDALYDTAVTAADVELANDSLAIRLALEGLAEQATDVAQEGEPRGDHFATPPLAALDGEPVWFLSVDAGWSAMFPADY
jgi:hypothetical protein